MEDEVAKYAKQSAYKPKYWTLKTLSHFHQSDIYLIAPFDQMLINRQKLPEKLWQEFYLMNIWLGMKFLEDEGLCVHPESQQGIYPRLKKVQSYIKEKTD